MLTKAQEQGELVLDAKMEVGKLIDETPPNAGGRPMTKTRSGNINFSITLNEETYSFLMKIMKTDCCSSKSRQISWIISEYYRDMKNKEQRKAQIQKALPSNVIQFPGSQIDC